MKLSPQCFVTSNIGTNLSPESNHLPKAQMELPCYKSHMEGRNHIELFPYWKINFPQLGIVFIRGSDEGSTKNIKLCPLS